MAFFTQCVWLFNVGFWDAMQMPEIILDKYYDKPAFARNNLRF